MCERSTEMNATNRVGSGKQHLHHVGVDLIKTDVAVRQQVGQVDAVRVGV